MSDFTKEDLLKIAKLSALNLSEKEIDLFTQQLNKVLDFVEQIKEVKVLQQASAIKNINIFRQDEVVPTDSKEVLNLSPDRQESYFVVPKILDENKGSTC
jgi:aspartyl-tRNA(Asn)/glutamyl-tRNA(Gln) amidotransferase subunit C